MEDLMKNELTPSDQAIAFPWAEKWLKGNQYAHILKNIDLYCQTYQLQKMGYKTHPESIYKEPLNGMIYFVEGQSLGHDFGFPRADIKKCYRWQERINQFLCIFKEKK